MMIFLSKKKKKNKNKISYHSQGGLKPMERLHLVRKFSDLNLKSADEYGFANAMLGEMNHGMAHRGIQVLTGFALSREGFERYLESNGLKPFISECVETVDMTDLGALAKVSALIQSRILKGTMPAEVVAELCSAYAAIGHGESSQSPLIVRNAPFVGENISLISEQSSCLNIIGEERLLQAVQRVYADAFSAKVLAHCTKHQLDIRDLSIAVSVQEMVYSDRCVSGMMYSVDPQTGYTDTVTIASTYGLGESINEGVVNPDEL